MKEKTRALFIGAHHEEIEAECPNIAAALSLAGCEVTILNPVGGWNWSFVRGLKGDGRKRVIADAVKAASQLGAKKVVWDYPIFQVDRFQGEIVDRLCDFLAEYDPQLVFIHWPRDINPDHRLIAHVSRHALSCCREISQDKLKKGRRGLKEVYAYQTGVAQAYHFIPDLLVVTDEKTMKMSDKCIESFAPTSNIYVEMWKRNFHAKAEYWGTMLEGGRFQAEALKFVGPRIPLEGFLLKKVLKERLVNPPIFEPYNDNPDWQL